MPELLRNAGLAMAATGLGITCLAGCSTPAEQKVDSNSLYGASADQSPLYAELTAEDDSMKPQDTDPFAVGQNDGQSEDNSIIGTPIEARAEELVSGAARITTNEYVGDYELGEDTKVALIGIDCEDDSIDHGRVIDTGSTEILEDGFRIEGLQCVNDIDEKTRPFVWKPGMHEGIDYSELLPQNAARFLVAVALDGNPNSIDFRFLPGDKSTAIEVHGLKAYSLGTTVVETK